MSQPTPDPRSLLGFEPPPAADPKEWVAAEKEALKFPVRFLRKAREALEGRQELKQAWDDKARLEELLYGFVVRNLLNVVDNCRPALSQPEAEPGRDGDPLEAAALASVYRTLVQVLEELGVVRVDLLGHTYEDVVVDGQKIEDPFEVQEAAQKGKTSDLQVREVIGDLWILRKKGHVKLLRKGIVNC